VATTSGKGKKVRKGGKKRRKNEKQGEREKETEMMVFKFCRIIN
jgi:hypothetical protein